MDNRNRYPQTLVSPPEEEDPSSGKTQHRDARKAMTNPDMLAHATSVPPPPAAPDPYVGKTIDGRYLVEATLGEGGMGVVYRGRHKVIDKRVAIKILRGEMARDVEMVQRFLNEARAASSIGNAHIVDIADFGQLPDGATYFVMEFLDGQSLSDRMAERGAMSPLEIAHIARQIAEGLGAAHDAGIIHRDLKPDNVMLLRRGDDRDFVKILDFGIAKVGGEGKRLTRAGSVFGTPHYMSPEQAAGAPVDQRTDIYSLGIIMYEMAAGRVPFDAENFMGILSQHMYKAPDSVRSLRADLPPAIDAIIIKCLSKKLENRFASMAELIRDLDKFTVGQVPESVPEIMGRLPGADAPPDYMWSDRSGLHSAVRDSPVQQSKRGWIIPVSASVIMVGAIATGILVYTGYKSKEQADPLTPVASAAPSGESSSAPLTQDPPVSSGSAVQLREVRISVNPSDAHVDRMVGDSKIDMDKAPVFLSLHPGEKATLIFSKPGFVARTVEVDGSKDRLEFTLARVGGGAPPPPVRPPASAKTPALPTAPPKGGCPPGEIFIYGKCDHI
jgi:serine/threonine-protein kinase